MMHIILQISFLISMAASPWPQVNHDQFNTRRSECEGPENPVTLWTKRSSAFEPVLDDKGNIVVGIVDERSFLQDGLMSVDHDGRLNWSMKSIIGWPPISLGDRIVTTTIDHRDVVSIDSGGILTTVDRSNAENGYLEVVSKSTNWIYLYRGILNREEPLNTSLYEIDRYDHGMALNLPINVRNYPNARLLAVGYDDIVYIDFECDLSHHNYCQTALNGDRSELWRFPKVNQNLYATSIPAIGSDGVLIMSIHNNSDNKDAVTAINPDGTQRWTVAYDDFNPTGSLAVDKDGTFYFCGDKPGANYQSEMLLGAFNPDGTRKWVLDMSPYGCRSPVIDSKGTIYISSVSRSNCITYAYNKSYLHAIKPDRTIKWAHEIEYYGCYSGTDMGIPVIADHGLIYVGVHDAVCLSGDNCPMDIHGASGHGHGIVAIGGDNDAGCGDWYDGSYGAHDTSYDVQPQGDASGAEVGDTPGVDTTDAGLGDATIPDDDGGTDSGAVVFTRAPGCGCLTIDL